MSTAVLSPLIAWFALTVLLALRGRRQRRDADAGLTALWRTAVIGAALVVAPWLTGAWIGVDSGFVRTSLLLSEEQVLEEYGAIPAHAEPLEDHEGYFLVDVELEARTGDGRVAFVAVLAAVLSSLAAWWSAMGPVPPGARRNRMPLEPIEGNEIAARFSSLCQRIGVVEPALRRWPASIVESSGAAVAGVVRPTVLLTDGLLRRYEPTNLDAIVAHELAHVRRRSIWRILGAWSVAWLGLVVASAMVPLELVVVLLLVVLVYGSRVLAQREEFTCDRLAASAVGPVAMYGALDKVHGQNRVPCSGIVLRLVHAVATHPAQVLRSRRLRELALPEERARIEVDEAEAKRQRITNLVVRTFVVLLVGAAIWLAAAGGGYASLGILLAFAAISLPVAFMVFTFLQLWRWHTQISSWRFPRGVLRGLLVLFALIAASITLAGGVDAIGWVVVVVTLFFVWRISRALRWDRRLHLALDRQELGAALEILGRMPSRLRRRPGTVMNHAWILAGAGRLDEAIEVLQGLCARRPRRVGPPLLLAGLMTYRDPAHSLEILAPVANRCSGNPYLLAAHARLLCRAGRAGDAEPVIARALAICDTNADAHAIRAEILLVRGDLDEAQRALERARALEPGNPRAFVTEVGLARQRGEMDAARAAYRLAEVEVARQPLRLQHYALELHAPSVNPLANADGARGEAPA